MTIHERLIVRGAREHNLKNVNLDMNELLKNFEQNSKHNLFNN